MFKKNFPGLAEWADGWGWLEIGPDQESRSLVRLLGEGGLVWESPDNLKSLDKALRAADQFIGTWIKENE